MKAIVQERYGPPEVLTYQDVAEPTLGDAEVLVQVKAASLNARDWHVMRGDPYIARLMDRSTFARKGPVVNVLGSDFAGTVVALGPGVSGFSVGDEVFGEHQRAFAEYVAVPTAAVTRKPANLSFEQAAAIPLAANTALMGVRDTARIQPGQSLLINGASGGVGPFAVQIARSMGANVTAVCSERNRDLVESLGANTVIDYARTDFTRSGRRYDIVFDLVGNRSLTALRRALNQGGRIVLSGGGVSRGGSIFGPIGLIVRGSLYGTLHPGRVSVLSVAPSADNLATLRDMAEAGTLTPVIDRTYPLADAAAAIRYMEVEHARAKVVLTT